MGLASISRFLSVLVDYVWGPPLVILLVGGGLLLLLYSRLLPLRGIPHAFRLVVGRIHHEGEDKAQGQISHFQALTNALAATIGLGNIAGVAVAITQGGPGAVFWMWVAAFIGMNTKFFECTLSVMYRGQDYQGEVQGGPMYVIRRALPKITHPLAYFFAFCGLIGTLALFQVNQLSAYLSEQYQVEPLIVGVVSAIFVFITVKGGVRRIGHITGTLVPVMCLLYVLMSMVVILLQLERVPLVFMRIFSEAFTGGAVLGGAEGYAVFQVLQIGVKRAAFSNEAGIGTAPMAHGNARTNEPISEGLVAMLGPFFDTMVVCTMTALVILLSLPPGSAQDASGIVLTTEAFEASLPGLGAHFIGVAVLLFALTTMLGMANYNQKCWDFIFKGRFGFGHTTFLAVFSVTLIWGSVSSMRDVVNLLDSGYALMAFPNMLATIWLAPKVKAAMSEYFTKYKL